MICSRILCLAFVLLSTSLLAQDHEHGAPAPTQVGTVSFPTSCAPEVQKDFERGVALLHSFWYAAAAQTFTQVAAKDPDCGIAWWGVSLSYFHQLWEPPNPQALRAGAEAAQKAVVTSAKSEREKSYIEAVSVFYRDWETQRHVTRVAAYAKAMQSVAAKYPEDREATIFYALALRSTASPADKSYSAALQAAALLEPIARELPNHPGVAHYLIHCYDYPSLARKGLEAARAYSKIAPDVPHALHMPSHIFTRLGYWDDSIASNEASAASARQHHLVGDELHADDYLAYAELQQGKYKSAREVVESAGHTRPEGQAYFAGLYARATIPARYAVERRDWKAAAALPVPEGLFPQSPLAVNGANLYFARGLGAAHTGDISGAEQAREKMEALAEIARKADDNFDAALIEMQRQAIEAWIAWAGKDQKDREKGLSLMSVAADTEDSSEKSPVTPEAIIPARELYAEMLLEAKRPKEALAAYEKVLIAAPNRLQATLGAAKSSAATGDNASARKYYAQILELTQNGDPGLAITAEAKAYLQQSANAR